MTTPAGRPVPDGVDPETGEAIGVTIQHVISLKAELARNMDIIAGLERDIRGWAWRYAELERDRAQEAREHALWPVGKLLFVAWQRYCDHGQARWQPERFWLCEPFLSRASYAKTLEARFVLSCRAIKGAQFDPWTKPRKNGTLYRHDGWETIFKSPGAFEDFRKRAPVDWRPRLSPATCAVIREAEARLERQREAAKQ